MNYHLMMPTVEVLLIQIYVIVKYPTAGIMFSEVFLKIITGRGS